MKKAVPFCVILVCLLVTKPVTASNWQKKWPDNEVTFHGHLEDFEHLRGVNLTQDQAKWWIAYSMQTWVSRTSADFQFGWETKNSVSSSECTDDDSDGEFESDGDSVSEISAPPGGKIPNQKKCRSLRKRPLGKRRIYRNGYLHLPGRYKVGREVIQISESKAHRPRGRVNSRTWTRNRLRRS